LWKNLQTLRHSKTIIGPAVVKFADENAIFFSAEPMPPNLLGYWDRERGIFFSNAFNMASADFKRMNMVHELVHAIQTKTGAIHERDMSWSIYELQKNHLSYEAAAKTAGYLIALEFMHAENPATWEAGAGDDPMRFEQILKAWNRACKDSASYTDALTRTGHDVFCQQFEEWAWLDTYNEIILSLYMKDLVEKRLQPPVSGNDSIITRDIRLSGHISPEFSFTAGFDSLPSPNLFGGNERMRHAFSYAELMRAHQTLGVNSAQYRDGLKKLQKENNPYIGVSIEDVYASYSAVKDPAYILYFMDKYAAEQKKKNAPTRAGAGLRKAS